MIEDSIGVEQERRAEKRGRRTLSRFLISDPGLLSHNLADTLVDLYNIKYSL